MTVKASVVHLKDYGGVENFYSTEVELPELAEGQVRIAVAAAAVNPVDVKARLGWLRDYVPLQFPARLGGDVSGMIEAVGPNVQGFAVGDRVVGMLNPFSEGSYASRVNAHVATLAHVPDKVGLVEAAATPTGVLTGIQLIEKGIQPSTGDKILIAGAAGSTGRAAVQAALDAGATVYAGVRPTSCQSVSDLPIAGVIDLANDSELDANGPFDAIADTVGGAPISRLYPWLKPDGIVASIAVPPADAPSIPTQRHKTLTVEFDRGRLERYLSDVALGRIRIAIADRLPLAKAGEAHARMEAGGVGGKLLLLP